MWVQLLQLVRGLRAAGIFTAVAVTRPFLFEGPKKRQAADTLTAQLQQCAHLVALIDQVRGTSQNPSTWQCRSWHASSGTLAVRNVCTT